MRETVSIPKVVYVDISFDDLISEARKMVSASEPKYKLFDIVSVKTVLGVFVPCVVIGVDSRSSAEWHYTLARPRGIDGAFERICEREPNVHDLKVK